MNKIVSYPLLNKSSEPPVASNSQVIDELWRRMSRVFGRTWVASFGERDDGTWASALSRFTPEQIGKAIDLAIASGEEWPPNLPQFRQLCLGNSVKSVSAMTDAELVRACRGAGIDTAGRSRKSLQSVLEQALLDGPTTSLKLA